MKCQIGSLYLVASEKGLQGVLWKEQPVPRVESLEGTHSTIQNLAQAVRELEEYFRGERKSFDVLLDLRGTEFQKKVWNQLLKIPYGQTNSYQEVAKKICHERAVRAVGTANGRNPVSIIIPCHRVISSDGSLGGYAGGLSIKEKLLKLER
jgi:methylated-DNA-[protein]-cysteine S-methyltransferase